MEDVPVPGKLDNEIFTADFGNAPYGQMAYRFSQREAAGVTLAELVQDGVPVARAPFPFELPRYLIEQRGRPVGQERLHDRRWQGRSIDER